jgi:oxepin-CoA hydrolase / 3-oxo-5,6-dehydrosuberyl-CoA semialdehyde dehydrogenase
MTTSAHTTNPSLQSFIANQWLGTTPAQALRSAVNGKTIAYTHHEAIDFSQAVDYARRVGVPAMLALNFQKRAQILRALAKYLTEHKEQMYAVSSHTGATRTDSWVDIEGGTGTLQAYSAMGANELPAGNTIHEGPPISLGKTGAFVGTHILVPRGGLAVHINAFNFPVWGLLEKFAPCFLAGMPCIAKPATSTSYLTEVCVRLMHQSGLLPDGSLQLVIGSTGELLDLLDERDVVTFTGSADTAAMLKVHPNLVKNSIPFNSEADSLNCAILADDVKVDDPEFDLFVKELVREMTVKAGQKCTAIRRAIVPRQHIAVLSEKLRDRLRKTTIGDPALEATRMGALASHAQQADVAERVNTLMKNAEAVFSAADGFAPQGDGVDQGSFYAPTLLLAHDAFASQAHEVEAFGPVSTLLAYDSIDQAIALAARGKGSLVGSLITHNTKTAAHVVTEIAALHGRVLVLDRDCAAESTGHGSPLPFLKHGGPGRAGGGEELGGLRAVNHYLQRAALQGSARMIAAITGEFTRGAPLIETSVHPFRRHFEQLQIGESLLTQLKTISDADVKAFADLTGDHFYMHFDEEAAKKSPFGKRIAHGYLVLSDAAGLFVSPEPGPVLANYGVDNLRFIKPVGIGDSIRARLTCKRKVDRNKKDANGQGQGVVVWDVAVTNQADELVASYDILTLVSKEGIKV